VRPLLEEITREIEAARVQALPNSDLAKGCNYTLRLLGPKRRNAIAFRTHGHDIWRFD
jgi:hypothetical protein